jgi:hypothetical protein
MLVLVAERLISLEQENVRVAAVREGDLGVGVELLRCTREPPLRPFPRLVIAIESRRSEDAIIPGEKEIGGANARGDPEKP